MGSYGSSIFSVFRNSILVSIVLYCIIHLVPVSFLAPMFTIMCLFDNNHAKCVRYNISAVGFFVFLAIFELFFFK